jgi:hypothetical protein
MYATLQYNKPNSLLQRVHLRRGSESTRILDHLKILPAKISNDPVFMSAGIMTRNLDTLRHGCFTNSGWMNLSIGSMLSILVSSGSKYYHMSPKC